MRLFIFLTLLTLAILGLAYPCGDQERDVINRLNCHRDQTKLAIDQAKTLDDTGGGQWMFTTAGIEELASDIKTTVAISNESHYSGLSTTSTLLGSYHEFGTQVTELMKILIARGKAGALNLLPSQKQQVHDLLVRFQASEGGLANFLHTLLDDEDARRALHRIQRALFDVERDAIAAYQG